MKTRTKIAMWVTFLLQPTLPMFSMDPVPPVIVGLSGLDIETGEVMWEAWKPEDLPKSFANRIPETAFSNSPSRRTNRSTQPAFGLPQTHNGFTIALDVTSTGYLPDEVTMVREKDGVEIARKSFPNVGFCVNAAGEHFVYLSPGGVLSFFPIKVPNEGELWNPSSEVTLRTGTESRPAFEFDNEVRIFSKDERFYIQIPGELLCFKENGEEIWRTQTDDFSPGDIYVGPPALHFLETSIYLLDGYRVAKLDLGSGHREWTTELRGFWYGPELSTVIPLEDGKTIAFSTSHFLNSNSPQIFQQLVYETGPFRRDLETHAEISESEKTQLLSYAVERRAFGDHAIKVHLSRILDEGFPDQNLAIELRHIVDSKWPVSFSDERGREYLIHGLLDPPKYPFDRTGAWASIFSSQWHEIEHWLKLSEVDREGVRFGLPIPLFWQDAPGELHRPDFSIATDVVRKIFENETKHEQLFAALILAQRAGHEDGFTKAEADRWIEDSNGLRVIIGTIAWAWLAEREELFKAMQNESLAWRRKMLRDCLIWKTDGEMSAPELQFWCKEAIQLTDLSSRMATFVGDFRLAYDGRFPKKFEQEVRNELIGSLTDSEDPDLGKFIALCQFDNPADDDVIGELEPLFINTVYGVEFELKGRQKRMNKK